MLADVDCGSGQGDVTVWQNILVRSVDYPMTERSCAGERSPDPTIPGQFEGVQVFGVSNPRNPQLVKLVDTDCGSHTNTLIPDLAHGRLLIYVLSYLLLPGPTCGDGREANRPQAKFSIMSVPLAHPQDAAVVATPAIDAEPFALGGSGRRSAATTSACSCRCGGPRSPASVRRSWGRSPTRSPRGRSRASRNRDGL